MDAAIVIHGIISARQFVSDEPMPDVEGPAELIVYPKGATRQETPRASIFDLFGKAEHLRSGEDIDAQIREEREAWGDR
jgi:hypothetical protein